MGGEVPVLVNARAEQPLQHLGSSGYGDARLMRRDFGGARKRLPVTANGRFRDPFDRLAKPLIGRQVEVRLRRVPGHSEALLREAVDPGGATRTLSRNP